ncbi:MAG: M23 family metallopeptidase [Bacteroidota bacterium]
MTPLRTAAVVAALLVSGFTAERLTSQDRALGSPPEAPVPPLAEAPAPRVDGAPREGLPPEAPVTRRLPMGPVQGPVSSPFGPRVHPVSGLVRHHNGVDIAVPAGTAVWTVAPGTIRSVGRQRGYGLVVEVDHPNGIGRRGPGSPVRTRYAHLASVDAALRPGLRVARGVALGASGGRPGRDGVSTGAHLHFEVRDADGRPLDPALVVRLPHARESGPLWTGRASRASDAPSPPPPPVPDATTADTARADADAAGSELPDLVLPDYPSLPAIHSSTPQAP